MKIVMKPIIIIMIDKHINKQKKINESDALSLWKRTRSTKIYTDITPYISKETQ